MPEKLNLPSAIEVRHVESICTKLNVEYALLTQQHLMQQNGSAEYSFKGENAVQALNCVYAHWWDNQKREQFLSKLDKLPEDLRLRVNESISIIREAYEKYPGIDSLSFSFNGGKDCTVLLYLIRHVRMMTSATRSIDTNGSSEDSKHLKTIYILPSNPFDLVEAFCEKTAIAHHLDLQRFPFPMREALAKFMEKNPGVKGVFLGVRRADPYAQNMRAFEETTAGWPKLMRINPILEWSYSEIWKFLRLMEIEYCELYDMGYTSLGSLDDTLPNPDLRKVDGGYWPAYHLQIDSSERAGRIKRSNN